MAAVTLETLISRIRQRADQEHVGSTQVTDATITRLINTSYAELYGYLIRASLNMVESVAEITADGSDNYELPTDFYSIISVFRVEGDQRVRLERHSNRHRLGANPAGDATSYRIINSRIEFYPRPGGGDYEVTYVPEPGELVDDDDTVDGVLGWEEYLVVDCAIKILDAEESDTTVHRQDRERLLARIQDDAAAAEMNESWRVETDRHPGQLRDLGDITGWRGYRGPIRGRY